MVVRPARARGARGVGGLGPEQERYVAAAAERLRTTLGDALLGVYVAGSAALDDWRAASSDIDVIAICAGALGEAEKRSLVDALRHAALPVPARGLELVVYRRGAVDFEVNLNTGPRMDEHVSFDPAEEPAHWFRIDLAIAHDHARRLLGPPAAQLIPSPPREALLVALRDSLRWHAENAAAHPDTVLNACRAWHYAATGAWAPKSAAGEWALQHTGAAVVADALALRAAGQRAGLPAEAVAAFAEDIAAHLG